MKKRLTTVIAILLCLIMASGFSSCGATNGDADETEEFAAATLEVNKNVPVSEQEIISFYNDIISKVQNNSNFTAENRPGVKTSESLKVNDIKILSYDAATDEATESDSLKALNKSAKAIKDRILSGIDTSVPVIPFGDMSTSVASVIYPYDSADMSVNTDDVISAECNVDANNLNISLVLSNTPETIEKVFGIRDKAELLKNMNENCAEYANINDYTQTFVEDADNNVHSVIYLSVEVEKQEDGTYKCTGRITSLDIKVVSDIAANVTAKGSFSDNGDLQVNFRLTDEKYYEFDWLGSSTWEPKAD